MPRYILGNVPGHEGTCPGTYSGMCLGMYRMYQGMRVHAQVHTRECTWACRYMSRYIPAYHAQSHGKLTVCQGPKVCYMMAWFPFCNTYLAWAPPQPAPHCWHPHCGQCWIHAGADEVSAQRTPGAPSSVTLLVVVTLHMPMRLHTVWQPQS